MKKKIFYNLIMFLLAVTFFSYIACSFDYVVGPSSFTDTSSTDFNKGTYYNTTTDGENVTLKMNGTREYPNTTGIFESQAFNYAEYIVDWTSISWNNVTVSNVAIVTNISIQTKTSNDGSSWTAWSSNHSNPSSLNIQSRFIQYQAFLTTNHTNFTPFLQDVTLNYTVSYKVIPTIIKFRGKLTDDDGNAITTGSLNVTIKHDEGGTLESTTGITEWSNTFDDVFDSKGVFSIELGASKAMYLNRQEKFRIIVEVDIGATTFSTADVTFGDGSPSTDFIKFVNPIKSRD